MKNIKLLFFSLLTALSFNAFGMEEGPPAKKRKTEDVPSEQTNVRTPASLKELAAAKIVKATREGLFQTSKEEKITTLEQLMRELGDEHESDDCKTLIAQQWMKDHPLFEKLKGYCPLVQCEGFEFENKVVGGTIPREFIPAVKKGLDEAQTTGVLGGYPTVDFKAILYDGSYHDVDSSEVAFKVAASMAFRTGMVQASPVLLEPVMKVVVEPPEEYMGDVMGDLNSRRGRIMGMDAQIAKQIITAEVPLGEMFGYATELRSMTKGRATYTMEFECYREVPKSVQESIVAKK